MIEKSSRTKRKELKMGMKKGGGTKNRERGSPGVRHAKLCQTALGTAPLKYKNLLTPAPGRPSRDGDKAGVCQAYQAAGAEHR